MQYDFSKTGPEDLHFCVIQTEKDGFPLGLLSLSESILKTIHYFERIKAVICYYRFSASA
jgi:hypothetical protein